MVAPDQTRDASYQRQIRTFTRSAIVDEFAVSPDHSDGGTSQPEGQQQRQISLVNGVTKTLRHY
jgi:hypothetical protein